MSCYNFIFRNKFSIETTEKIQIESLKLCECLSVQQVSQIPCVRVHFNDYFIICHFSLSLSIEQKESYITQKLKTRRI